MEFQDKFTLQLEVISEERLIQFQPGIFQKCYVMLNILSNIREYNGTF